MNNNNSKPQPGIVFFYSYMRNYVSFLNPEQLYNVLSAIMEHQMNGTEINPDERFSDVPSRMFFAKLLEDVERNDQAYLDTCETNRRNALVRHARERIKKANPTIKATELDKLVELEVNDRMQSDATACDRIQADADGANNNYSYNQNIKKNNNHKPNLKGSDEPLPHLSGDYFSDGFWKQAIKLSRTELKGKLTPEEINFACQVISIYFDRYEEYWAEPHLNPLSNKALANAITNIATFEPFMDLDLNYATKLVDTWFNDSNADRDTTDWNICYFATHQTLEHMVNLYNLIGTEGR